MERERTVVLVAGLPSKVWSIIAPLSEEELRWRPKEGEWSAKEVVCHLRDAAEIYGQRIRRMATEERPFLPAFNQEDYARERQYQDDIAQTVMQRYTEFHAATVVLLRALTADAWSREGVHEEDGPMTLQAMVERVVAHETAHLQQLRHLRDGAREIQASS